MSGRAFAAGALALGGLLALIVLSGILQAPDPGAPPLEKAAPSPRDATPKKGDDPAGGSPQAGKRETDATDGAGDSPGGEATGEGGFGAGGFGGNATGDASSSSPGGQGHNASGVRGGGNSSGGGGGSGGAARSGQGGGTGEGAGFEREPGAGHDPGGKGEEAPSGGSAPSPRSEPGTVPPRERPKLDAKTILILGALLLGLAALAFAILGGERWLRARRGSAGAAAAASAPDGAIAALSGSGLPRDAFQAGASGDVVHAYLSACALLARAGHLRAPPETAREFATRIPGTPGDALRELTLLYEAARHSGAPLRSDDASRASALAQRIAAEVAAPA